MLDKASNGWVYQASRLRLWGGICGTTNSPFNSRDCFFYVKIKAIWELRRPLPHRESLGLLQARATRPLDNDKGVPRGRAAEDGSCLSPPRPVPLQPAVLVAVLVGARGPAGLAESVVARSVDVARLGEDTDVVGAHGHVDDVDALAQIDQAHVAHSVGQELDGGGLAAVGGLTEAVGRAPDVEVSVGTQGGGQPPPRRQLRNPQALQGRHHRRLARRLVGRGLPSQTALVARVAPRVHLALGRQQGEGRLVGHQLRDGPGRDGPYALVVRSPFFRLQWWRW